MSIRYLLFAGLIFRLLIFLLAFSGDVNNHIAWGQDLLLNGASGIYGRNFQPTYGVLTPTYPPIPLFLFAISQAVYDFTYSIFWTLNINIGFFPSGLIFFLEKPETLPAFTKIWAILADIGIAYFVYKFAINIYKSEKVGMIAATFILFNPAFFYNSAVWGQIESVPLLFMMIFAYLYLFTDRKYLSALAYTVAILIKQTTLVFAPVVAILFIKKYGLKESIKSGLAGAALFWISFLPFYNGGNLILFPFETYLNKIQTGSGSSFVTDHAFNLWAIIVGLGKILDSNVFLLGQPYSYWGYAISGILILLLIFRLYKSKLGNQTILLALALAPFIGFLFLTRMHERYLENALPFLLLVSLKSKRLMILFVGISIFHFLNLYHDWWVPNIPIVVDVLSEVFTITLLSVFAILTLSIYFINFIRHSN